MPDVLQQWLLNIATRPPQEWHAYDRLALADYLEERGDPRAAFVRGDSPCRDDIEVVSATGATGKIPGLIDGYRERRRLLGLFPDVALEGPCPDHRGLPEGVEANFATEDGKMLLHMGAGYCLVCGHAGAPGGRAAPAPDWLPAGSLAKGRLDFPVRTLARVVGGGEVRGSFVVWMGLGIVAVALPADRHGAPVVTLPRADMLGRPVCPAPPG